MTKDELAIKMLKKYGFKMQLDIVIEEMAELTKEIMKFKRDDAASTLDNLLEEYVDVNIALANVKKILKIYGPNVEEEIIKMEKEKIDRTVKRCLSE